MTIESVFNLLTTLGIMLTAYFTWRAKQIATDTNHVATDTKAIAEKTAEDIQIVEKATNGMKDALIAATERGAMAEGLAQGREEGRTEGQAADIAERQDASNIYQREDRREDRRDEREDRRDLREDRRDLRDEETDRRRTEQAMRDP